MGRHSPVACVTLEVAERATEAIFTVSDDGVGFAPLPAGAGIGLLSIRDRVGAMGGRVQIASALGAGMVISAVIPSSPA
jgi:signal transduction histidine kinase